ncbi:MAG: hypothetical protein U1F71_16560 [Verrucomicrobiaceae bacterium]
MRNPRRMQPNAFTLVEVSVSTALALLLLLSLSMAVMDVTHQGRRLSDHLDRGARVRLMTSLLVSDLQSAIVRQDGNTWLAIDILAKTDNSGSWVNAAGQKPAEASLQLDPREKDEKGREWANPEDYRFGVGGMWLRFITTAADRDVFTDGKPVSGDVNAVSYQLIRRAMPSAGFINDDANASYQLFRSIVRSDHTFENGYVVDAYDSGSAQQGEPGEMKSPSPDSMLCDNIIDFGIIIHEWSDDGRIVQGFPMRHESLPPLKDKNRYRVPQDGVPAMIEVMVRVLSASGARELRGLETQGISPEQWWQIARRESRVYSRSVSLPRSL